MPVYPGALRLARYPGAIPGGANRLSKDYL